MHEDKCQKIMSKVLKYFAKCIPSQVRRERDEASARLRSLQEETADAAAAREASEGALRSRAERAERRVRPTQLRRAPLCLGIMEGGRSSGLQPKFWCESRASGIYSSALLFGVQTVSPSLSTPMSGPVMTCAIARCATLRPRMPARPRTWRTRAHSSWWTRTASRALAERQTI